MHMLLPALLIIGAFAFLVAAQHASAIRTRRLQLLVEAEHKRVETARADLPMAAEHLFSRNVVRNLHLLGIEPDFRETNVTLAVAGLSFLVVAFFLGPVPAFALASILLLAGLMLLNILAARRVAELGALMPSFFDRVRQLLTIGNSLPTAFVRSVHGAPPRLTKFFAPTVRRLCNGASFSESIRQIAEDIDMYEMRLFAAAVSTNMRFGGSLDQSLNNLVSYLRKRASIERELRANTAQIRASAWVLGMLPMLVAGLIVFQNQDYARWFIYHPAGKKMLAYCIVSQIIGVFLMRMVVRTKF